MSTHLSEFWNKFWKTGTPVLLKSLQGLKGTHLGAERMVVLSIFMYFLLIQTY
jgi:hypothetical protein